MEIAFINGSPKIKGSASEYILQELKIFLENDNNTISQHHFIKPKLSIEEMEQLKECNVMVFAFPLYVDGVPSHVLNCLIQLEMFLTKAKEKNITVYCLVNCGFYEGYQSTLAIEIMENWCVKAGTRSWHRGRWNAYSNKKCSNRS